MVSFSITTRALHRDRGLPFSFKSFKLFELIINCLSTTNHFSSIPTPHSPQHHAMLSKIIALSLIASAAAGGALTKCDSDGDCPSSYCMKSAGKSPPFTCHDCGANCCNSDVDCKGSYCMKDQTKKAPFQCHAAVGATMVEVAAPVTNWTSCGTLGEYTLFFCSM